MNKIISSIFCTALLGFNFYAQNVGIGTSTPHASSRLEVSSTNSGILIPRVALTATNSAGPIVSPATSLMVFNTATASTGTANEVTPGYYYWSGSAWLRMTQNGWRVGASAAETNVIGTAGTSGFFGTNSNSHIDLVTNNAVRGRITNTGEFNWGTVTAPYTLSLMNVVGTAALPNAINGYTSFNASAIYGETVSGSTNNSTITGYYGGTGNGSAILGTYGGSNTSTTRSGIYGQTSGNSNGGAGVIGYNGATSGNMHMGVYGTYNQATSGFGIGVIGVGFGGGLLTGNVDAAVVGMRANNQNFSGYFNGNHVIANGTKSASVPTSKGNQLLYCMESPEVWFEEIGGGKLVNGVAVIQLDPLFLETVLIDDNHPMHVFVQLQGECNDVYVVPGTTGFTVKEKNGGTSNVSFSYRLVAKRVQFPDHRFGSDPVWGDGDNRQYMDISPARPIDYKEAVKFDEEMKRNWKQSKNPSLSYPEPMEKEISKSRN